MHAKIFSAAPIGVQAQLVSVEADVSFGLVSFHIVGLPDTGIKESVKRIQTALKNSGINLPAKRITVNLAPADIKKEGSAFDLPIALGILLASGHLAVDRTMLDTSLFLGELSLDGGIRFVKGVLAIAQQAAHLNKKRLFVPAENSSEAALIHGIEVYGMNHLTELITFLRGESLQTPSAKTGITFSEQSASLDFAQVKGQQQAKRALQIAASGRHNILFVGPPGSGKTMLAQRLATLMPPLTLEEIIDTSTVYSVGGKLGNASLILERPFRNPHHTISCAALIGGGTYPQPGEVSLAHHGILFLDELTEFKRATLEALRQPLEERNVSIARVNQTIQFPASFLLIAALNPCPCGYFGDKTRTCVCSRFAIQQYLSKISGPLLDRIDLQIPIAAIDYNTIKSDATQISTATLKRGVEQSISIQKTRFGSPLKFNATMRSDEVERFCTLSPESEQLMKQIFEKYKLSMRGYHKLLKVARTIADIEQSDKICESHIMEASMYRCLDQYLEQNNAL